MADKDDRKNEDRKTEEPASGPSTPCPRCGGKPAPKRAPSKANPFLPKVKHLTCNDCGLDYSEDGKPVRP